jgi:hypothetical protein
MKKYTPYEQDVATLTYVWPTADYDYNVVRNKRKVISLSIPINCV